MRSWSGWLIWIPQSTSPVSQCSFLITIILRLILVFSNSHLTVTSNKFLVECFSSDDRLFISNDVTVKFKFPYRHLFAASSPSHCPSAPMPLWNSNKDATYLFFVVPYWVAWLINWMFTCPLTGSILCMWCWWYCSWFVLDI